MSPTITTADVASLCGRPAAFVRFVMPLVAVHPEHRRADVVELRRLGRFEIMRDARVAWWLWPWAPGGRHEPWTSIDAPELERVRQWLRARKTEPVPELRFVLARAPRDPSEWIAELSARLGALTRGGELRVRIHGPDEIQQWTEDIGTSLYTDGLRANQVMTAQLPARSACERELIAALDAGLDSHEPWLVVADELQRDGDATGESLALALASAPDRPTHTRELSQAYIDHEAMRMARAPRHQRMLAFVDARGASFPAAEFDPNPTAAHEAHSVQLWAERVGPFFVRMLAVTDDPACAGLGLPEAVFAAPQLRYLSPARLACIDPHGADISSRDLSGFALALLPEQRNRVFAYDACLRGCELARANLSGWQLDGADLRDAVADLDTHFGQASFDDARVSPALQRLLDSWNGGRHRRARGRHAGTASVRRLVVSPPAT